MTVDEALVSRLATAPDVAALVGERIFAEVLPYGQAMPAITYQHISLSPLPVLRGTAGLDNPRVQIDCWADTYNEARSLARAVRGAMKGLESVAESYIGAASLIGSRGLPDADSRRSRVSMDFSLWHPEET